MFTRLIPNKEVTIKIFALKYRTGVLYIKSEDNSNKGVMSKKFDYNMSGIYMVPAYTYEDAITNLNALLLEDADLFLKDIIIEDYNVIDLNDAFDIAHDLYGENVEDDDQEDEIDNE